MDEKGSLIAKRDKRGIKKIVNNVVEFIKSKINKEYILSESSPEFLKQNRDLILKTVKVDKLYLNQVSDDILLEELRQQQLPTNGILDTAFKSGYNIDSNSHPVLLSEHAKVAILKYVGMKKNSSGSKNKVIENVVSNLDDSVLQDIEFVEKFLDLAIEMGYKLSPKSPIQLKQNNRLAENYYRDLLENNRDGILTKNILNIELLKNKDFLETYINLLKKDGIDEDIIVRSLVCDEKCTDILKNNLELFQVVFESLVPSNLAGFFNKFFSDKELESFFAEGQEFQGMLLKLSQLYAKDNSILQSLNGELLQEQYQSIPEYKMQLIAKNPKYQDRLLGFNEYEYCLYDKMAQLVAQKTDRWNRFDKIIVDNLSDGYYGELISDLYEQAKAGNKITSKDLETLTFLLSKSCPLKSFVCDTIQGFDETSIEQNESIYSNNVFNITSKKELEHFEEIKELVCDTILTDPSLKDEQLTAPISKYLGRFKKLSELDRIKLALLQKYYNMDLIEASDIVNKFATDIDSIDVNDEDKLNIIEQIKAIKNIFESDDINVLRQIGELNILVRTDLASSTYLVEEAKEMFEQLYKEDLYMPKKDEDKIGITTYNGINIDVFDAKTDFQMIVKWVGVKNGNSQEIWNSMTKDEDDGKKDLRFYTCTSYMTDENLLNKDNENEVILGFAQGVNNYSFDSIYPHDAGTTYRGGDDIYNEVNGVYMTPSTLEMKTNNIYNEVVINTLAITENGEMTKMQPDYIVYVKSQNDMDLENDPIWNNSKKVASEFGIPIVVIDREKVRESEKNKIAEMSKKMLSIPGIPLSKVGPVGGPPPSMPPPKAGPVGGPPPSMPPKVGPLGGPPSSILSPKVDLLPSANDIEKFVKKVEHYISRYGENGILEYASQDRMEFLKKYIEEKRFEKQSKSALPELIIATEIVEQVNNSRQGILDRQDELIQKNVIVGDER